MEKIKVKLEIYEGDPFGRTCCGPVPRLNSPNSVEKLRLMLIERNQIAEKLSEEFGDTVQVKREIISQKRSEYPEYLRKLLFDDEPLPYIFINNEAVVTGKFPTYQEFIALLKPHLKSEATN